MWQDGDDDDDDAVKDDVVNDPEEKGPPVVIDLRDDEDKDEEIASLRKALGKKDMELKQREEESAKWKKQAKELEGAVIRGTVDADLAKVSIEQLTLTNAALESARKKDSEELAVKKRSDELGLMRGGCGCE